MFILIMLMFSMYTSAIIASPVKSEDVFENLNVNFDNENSFFKRSSSSYQNSRRSDGTGFDVKINHQSPVDGASNGNNNYHSDGGNNIRGNNLQSHSTNNNEARYQSTNDQSNVNNRPFDSRAPINDHVSRSSDHQSQGAKSYSYNHDNNNFHNNNNNNNNNNHNNNYDGHHNNNNNHQNGNTNRASDNHQHNHYGDGSSHSSNWPERGHESPHRPASHHQPQNGRSSFSSDHDVDNVHLPSNVPDPANDPRAQFIKERVGEENSHGKPFGSKLKYSFRDPKTPNNYMEVTEVRMSMNRRYSDNDPHGNHGSHENYSGPDGPSGGYSGPPPPPPPPPPPAYSHGPNYSPHASSSRPNIHDGYDSLSRSSSGPDDFDFDSNAPDFNMDGPVEPVEPVGPSASSSQNHAVSNNRAPNVHEMRQRSERRVITGPNLGDGDTFTDLSTFFRRPENPTSSSDVKPVQSNSDGDSSIPSNIETLFTDAFFSDSHSIES